MAILQDLVSAGVTHVIGVPDNTSAPLFAELSEQAEIRLLTVTREGEAFAIAAGLWLGGARPVVLVQNTGLLESGDSLRGTASRMGVPLVCLVTYRGFGKHRVIGPDAPDVMTRADADSVATLTEPTLDAWRIPYEIYHPKAVEAAFAQADAEERPVAVLLPR